MKIEGWGNATFERIKFFKDEIYIRWPKELPKAATINPSRLQITALKLEPQF